VTPFLAALAVATALSGTVATGIASADNNLPNGPSPTGQNGKKMCWVRTQDDGTQIYVPDGTKRTLVATDGTKKTQVCSDGSWALTLPTGGALASTVAVYYSSPPVLAAATQS
jgi:hypothetical protein